MPDPRFYESLGPISLAEIGVLTGAQLASPAEGARLIDRVAVLSRGDARAATFLTDHRQAAELAEGAAGACFTAEANTAALPAGCVALITPHPQAAYAVLAGRLHRLKRVTPGPAIAASAILEEGVLLAPGVVVGDGAQIGRGSQIGPNTVVGPGVTIGRDCLIGANVSLACCLIGDRVMILAGAVIGEAGFGAAGGPKGVIDMPQLGRVIIQDGCTVGANSCIDRGAYDDTMIGENTKIDNLVQIAHNVRVGRNVVMAAHTGISGSVTIGDGVQFGGRAGIADHIVVGAGARIAGASGVMHNVPPGETWGGAPAQQIKAWMREIAWLRRQSTRKDGA